MTAAAKQNSRPSIDDLKESYAAERKFLARVEERLEQLQAERQAALLDDDDSSLADTETAIAACQRQVERHTARSEHFFVKIEEAEDVEREAQALADYERAARQIEEVKSWLLNDYPAQARKLAGGLAQLHAADRLAERMNSELPKGCPPLLPPSYARHVAQENNRREIRKCLLWVGQDGRELGAVQIVGGKPTTAGARLVEREVEVEIAGRKPWWPSPLYSEVTLPRLHRDDEDFWLP